MAQVEDLKIEVRATWVKHITLFICRHVKKRWVLRLFLDFTIARLYVNGKSKGDITLGEFMQYGKKQGYYRKRFPLGGIVNDPKFDQ